MIKQTINENEQDTEVSEKLDILIEQNEKIIELLETICSNNMFNANSEDRYYLDEFNCHNKESYYDNASFNNDIFKRQT